MVTGCPEKRSWSTWRCRNLNLCNSALHHHQWRSIHPLLHHNNWRQIEIHTFWFVSTYMCLQSTIHRQLQRIDNRGQKGFKLSKSRRASLAVSIVAVSVPFREAWNRKERYIKKSTKRANYFLKCSGLDQGCLTYVKIYPIYTLWMTSQVANVFLLFRVNSMIMINMKSIFYFHLQALCTCLYMSIKIKSMWPVIQGIFQARQFQNGLNWQI